MRSLTVFFMLGFILFCSNGYTGVGAIEYSADWNIPIFSPLKEQAQHLFNDLKSDNSNELHLANQKDYELLIEYEKKYGLDRIVLLYRHPTSHNTKILQIPISAAQEGQSPQQGSRGNQQQSSTSSTPQQSGSRTSCSASSSGAGGDNPPPPDPNKKQSTNSHYLESPDLIDWLFAIWNYWWIKSATEKAASRLAHAVPEHQVTHWMSEHNILTTGGFVLVGIAAGYAIDRLAGDWSLTANAFRALEFGTGIRVINWFSPQIFAQAVNYSHYIFLSHIGYRLGSSFSRHLNTRLARIQDQRMAPPPYEPYPPYDPPPPYEEQQNGDGDEDENQNRGHSYLRINGRNIFDLHF